MSSNTTEKVTRLNLNDTVFFELNDVSLKLLAPTTEEQVRLIRDNVSEHQVDGQTRHLAKMQLHDFIRTFSKAIGPGNPAPVAGNDLYVIEKTTTVSGPIEPPAKSLKEPRDPGRSPVNSKNSSPPIPPRRAIHGPPGTSPSPTASPGLPQTCPPATSTTPTRQPSASPHTLPQAGASRRRPTGPACSPRHPDASPKHTPGNPSSSRELPP